MSTSYLAHTAVKHKHHPPPLPASAFSPKRSISISLPTPDLLSSIAPAAHYAGGITSPNRAHSPEQKLRHRRAASASYDDPSVEDLYREVMEDLKEMFCGRTSVEILRRRWAKDAVFEDPLSKCEGYDEYAPQWFALGKLFNSERISSRILSATIDPNRLIFSQTQEYTLRWIGYKKIVTSIVLVDLDEDFRITRLVDQWNGEDPPTRWGSLFFRKVNAKLTPWLIRVPKN